MLTVDTLNPLVGHWHLAAYEGDVEWEQDADGIWRIANPLVWEQHKTNLITTVGKGLALDRLFGLSSAVALSGTAVGTSATAAAVGDTALTGAVYQAFDATPTRSSLTVTAATTYGTGAANITIAEAGLMTASAGVLFNRLAPIGPFTKTSAVSLRIQTTITQS